MIFRDHECDSVDCDFAVHEPSKFAAVSEAPVTCQECDQEEGSCESAKFTSSGATYVDGSIDWACSLVERKMLVRS